MSHPPFSPAPQRNRLRNVLIVAPHFPPSGLPPSHRARQFAVHLPRYGWRPTVLTVRPEFYQETLEPKLCDLIPRDLDVVRTGALRPKRPGGWGIGDLGIRVLWHQSRIIAQLCRDRNIDLVYLTCPPNHQLLLGRLVHARLGVPYVIDYTDPWRSDWLETHARPFTKLWVVHQLAKSLEPVAIKRAAGITAVSQGTARGVLERYSHVPTDRGLTVPIGAEPELYDEIRRRHSRAVTPSGVRRLLYLGAMWEAAYDTLRAFLAALRLVKERAPELYRNCGVDFVGTSYAPNALSIHQVAPMARDAGVGDVVTETPTRLPFLDALASLATSDRLLMLGSSEPHYTPSRLLPYVFARRPILAVMHASSDATVHLRRHRGARVVTYDASTATGDLISEIYRALIAWLQRGWEPDLDPPGESWDPYTAQALTGQVARFFDLATTSPAR